MSHKHSNYLNSFSANTIFSGSTDLSELLGSSNLTIEDDGIDLSTGSTSVINFIGSGVTAIQRTSGDGNIIDVYIPAFTIASHWDTNDGTTDGTVDESISRTNKRISTPNGGEGSPFGTGGWAGSSQSSSLNSTVTITSAEETTGFGGDSTMQVVVYSADSSVIADYTTPPIIENDVFVDGQITVTIADFDTDTTRFKAKATVLVDINTLLSNLGADGGRYHVEVTHHTDTTTDGTGPYTYVQSDVFYDTQPDDVSITSAAIAETNGQIVTKFISGIQYYTINSQFTVDATDMDYLNANTIRLNHNLSLVGTEYNLVNYNDLSYNPSEGIFSNYTDDDNNTGADYQRTDWTITTTNQRRRSNTANITAEVKDAWDVNNQTVPSANANILIDTFSDDSTILNETFNGESQRYTDDQYTTSWDSESVLQSGEALVLGGQMMIPSTSTLTTGGGNANWVSYKPDLNVANPDYTALSGPSSFYRKFEQVSGDINGFVISFTGEFNGSDALADLVSEDLQIFIRRINSNDGNSLTGVAAPANNVHGTPYNNANYDQGVTDGQIRTGVIGNNNTINCTLGGFSATEGVYCEIKINNTNIKLTSVQFAFS